jgi:8-oxo-dGTP diphosphatase
MASSIQSKHFYRKGEKIMPGKFLVGVSALIERDDTILLLKRVSTKDHGSKEWEPVSGRVEPGESATMAVSREVLEETALVVEVLQPFDTFYFLRGESKEELIGITFLCRYVSGELRISEEHSEAQWIPIESLLELDVIPPIKECFKKYLQLKS